MTNWLADKELVSGLEEFLTAAPSSAEREPALTPGQRAESILRSVLGEFNFEFASDDLENLEAFMISEDGYRAIITAADLDEPARIALYLHVLGHIALGHIHEEHHNIRYEVRVRDALPAHLQVEEYTADRWAVHFLQRRLIPQCKPMSPFREGGLQAARHLRMRPGQLRHGFAWLTDFFYENVSAYRSVRLRPEVQGLLAIVYRRLHGFLPGS